MINFYQGRVNVDKQDSQVYELDSENIIEQYKVILRRHVDSLPEPAVYVRCLEMRYHFIISIAKHSRIPVRRILNFLKSTFSQFIWTGIVEFGDTGYKLEFIPVSWSHYNEQSADKVLQMAILEMGFGRDKVIDSIKTELEAIFRELFNFAENIDNREVDQTMIVGKRPAVPDESSVASKKLNLSKEALLVENEADHDSTLSRMYHTLNKIDQLKLQDRVKKVPAQGDVSVHEADLPSNEQVAATTIAAKSHDILGLINNFKKKMPPKSINEKN